MTGTIHSMSSGSASDDALVHRLYELARSSQCDPREAAMVDFLVYTRLAETYGAPPPAPPGGERLKAA